MARDYYDVLGVSRGADQDEIQQAYRTLARQYHPDINKSPEAEERFKELNEAHSVLSDPSTRKRYDRFGEDFRQIPDDYEERMAAAGGGSGFRGRGAGGPHVRYGTGGGDVFTDGDVFTGDGADFEDILGSLFGGRTATGPVPGADQEAELPLTVEEAYRGGRRSVQLAGPSGQRSYEVSVPPGVVDGQRIRLAGEGGRGGRNGPSGDLYLHVAIKPDSRFRLDGRDVHVRLPVAPWEAALGATVPVPTPGGTAKVTVPPGSSTGRRQRLRGEGMPNPRGTNGDLYADVRVAVPSRLSDRERELFEELSAASSFDPRTTR